MWRGTHFNYALIPFKMPELFPDKTWLSQFIHGPKFDFRSECLKVKQDEISALKEEVEAKKEEVKVKKEEIKLKEKEIKAKKEEIKEKEIKIGLGSGEPKPGSSKTMPTITVPHLAPPDLDLESKEPWAADAELIIPIQLDQVLIHESAAIVGAQAFLNIAHLPYEINERSNATDISPSGKLPVLKCGAYVVSELEGIVQLAMAKGVSLSDHLNSTEKADMRAYMSLVHNVLGNALMYFTWVDNDVYSNFTRFRAGSPYNFPLKYLMPWYIRRDVVNSLNTLHWGGRKSTEVYSEVETCLLALSQRLGESEYFFGDSPTELDALVFGYLFTMITTPLPNNQLGNIVKLQPNLIQFCQHVEKEYFSQSR